jgi:hypothetical protein
MNFKKTILLFFMSTLLIAQTSGPINKDVNVKSYDNVLYISESGSDESGLGTKDNPYKSITKAIMNLENNGKTALFIAEGKYSVSSLKLKNGIELYGGFNSKTWERNIYKNISVVTADSGKNAFICADNSVIDGFLFRKNIIRGKGAAIYCEGGSPVITNNTFTQNKTLGALKWKPKYMHELANDGGAIACENNSSPIISNNMFYKNYTENGRGAAIALNNNCNGEITNNVFIKNETGLNDPMRSSDGGAVSIFNWCSPLIENNIFIENQALASNDAGALFAALWSSPKIINNIFVGSKSGDDAGALFVGGQEHRYNSPLDPLPPKEKFFVEIDRNLFVGNSNPSHNSGVMRFTMESRGKFTNNICFNNSGIYFQRSETEIYNNTLLENFILIETKEGLGKSSVINNIIWGSLYIDAPSEFSNNVMKEKYEGNNIYKDPHFIDDALTFHPIAVSYESTRNFTNIYLSGLNLTPNSLVRRIVRVGNSWGVVKSNDANNIEIWGDFTDGLEFFVLQSLSLSSKSPCINNGLELKSVNHDYYNEKRPKNGRFDIGAIESN